MTERQLPFGWQLPSMFEREHKCSKTKAKKDSFDFPISDIFCDSPSTMGLKLCYTNSLKLATYHVSNMFGHGFSCQILHNTIGFSLLTVKPLYMQLTTFHYIFFLQFLNKMFYVYYFITYIKILYQCHFFILFYFKKKFNKYFHIMLFMLILLFMTCQIGTLYCCQVLIYVTHLCNLGVNFQITEMAHLDPRQYGFHGLGYYTLPEDKGLR